MEFSSFAETKDDAEMAKLNKELELFLGDGLGRFEGKFKLILLDSIKMNGEKLGEVWKIWMKNVENFGQ
jgi:hypothetical protein